MKNTFRKYERLCNKSSIENLFKKGQAIYLSPLSVKWVFSPVQMRESPCKVLLIAPKKLFRHATERNRRKRLLRESFRVQKYKLYNFLNENNIQVHLSVSFINNQELTKQQLDDFISLMLDKLIKRMSNQLPEK